MPSEEEGIKTKGVTMAKWRVQLYPHSGRYLVSDGPLEVWGINSIASFTREEDAMRFAAAQNEWEHTSPKPRDFEGCEPFPTPDRYEVGMAIFDCDPIDPGNEA